MHSGGFTDCRLDGNKMDRIAKEHEIQVIWVILTAYIKDTTLKQVLEYKFTWVDA